VNTHAGRKLSRPTGARKSLLRNLTVSLFRHEQIRTTVPKAKELSRFADGVLALAKQKTLEGRRRVSGEINDKMIRRKIYDVLVPRYQTREGGCTRIHRIGARSGDNAEMALIRLVQ
jgi:large subunit ribosomal protein L17